MSLQVQGSDKTKLEVHDSVRARFKIKNSYKIRREVHASATAGARQRRYKVRGAWPFQKRLKRQDKERIASVPLWMQENDEPK